MPIKIPDQLPARAILENENIFVMTEYRAIHQDIRPLRIAIVNLMPTKITTETQLLRLLANSPLQVEPLLIKTASHVSKNTPAEHLQTFYKTFDEVSHEKFDGLIITGAPVEHLEFDDVNYWNELCRIMEWSKHNVFSTLYICWAAQAGLFYHFGVPKHELEKKMFGVFRHYSLNPTHQLLRGFDDYYYAPHSRHTEIRREDIEKIPELEILSYSDEAGVYIVANRNNRQFFVTGHAEYDRDTLALEYYRDKGKGLDIDIPKNYFIDDRPENGAAVTWRGHAHLLFSNWLNYFVYQTTPYDISKIE